MSRITTALFTATLLAACSGDEPEAAGSATGAEFTGIVDGRELKVAVQCSHFNEDYFQFQSDKTDVSDSNGDGLVISGMQNNGKLVLTVIENGTVYSTPNLDTFSKSESIVSGSGTLQQEGSAATVPVEFTVNC